MGIVAIDNALGRVAIPAEEKGIYTVDKVKECVGMARGFRCLEGLIQRLEGPLPTEAIMSISTFLMETEEVQRRISWLF